MDEKNSPYNFLDFKVLNEPWNLYELEDHSILKVKVVLINVIKENGVFSLQTRNVIGVIPNPSLIGSPSSPLKPGETLDSYIEKEDLKIVDEKAVDWNEYEIPSENMRLSIKGIPVIISRTSRRDEKGIPLYLANIQILIKPLRKS